MAIQFSRYQCRACGKPALHVRNRYEVPYVAHLLLICALGIASLIGGVLGPLLLGAAGVWLVVWAAHWIANMVATGEPFRCSACGMEVGDSQKSI